MIAAISVVIGVLMSILSMRNFTKSRQATVFLDCHRQVDLQFLNTMSEILIEWSWTSPEDFMNKYGPRSNPEAWAKFILYASFFDSMGKLIDRKLTDTNLIPESLAVLGVSWYEKFESIEPYIIARWKRSGSDDAVGLLYQKLKKLGYQSPVETDGSASR